MAIPETEKSSPASRISLRMRQKYDSVTPMYDANVRADTTSTISGRYFSTATIRYRASPRMYFNFCSHV